MVGCGSLTGGCYYPGDTKFLYRNTCNLKMWQVNVFNNEYDLIAERSRFMVWLVNSF